MATKSITIGLDVNDVALPVHFEKINIGFLMQKFNFSIVASSHEEKLTMIVQELIAANDILVGFAANTLSDVLFINEKLSNFNSSLHTVYVPSLERINQQLLQARRNAKLHGRWLGTSEENEEKVLKN